MACSRQGVYQDIKQDMKQDMKCSKEMLQIETAREMRRRDARSRCGTEIGMNSLEVMIGMTSLDRVHPDN